MKRIFILWLAFTVPLFGLGIPVIDVSNLAQNLITALNTVRSVAQQTLSYTTQLNQYTTQLRSYIQQMKDAAGITAAMQVYQQYQQTMGELQSLQYQFQNAGQLTAMLNQFQDQNYWMQANRYPAQMPGSTLQKQQDDAWIKSLAAHQRLLQQDAQNLERLQDSAQNAGGQMQAIQASAQIAASQAEQLMEIHALLVSEQEALAARQMTLANEEAMKEAASRQYDTWNFQPGNHPGFRP